MHETLNTINTMSFEEWAIANEETLMQLHADFVAETGCNMPFGHFCCQMFNECNG